MLLLENRSLKWAPTAWQRFQARENQPKSLLWHLELAQDKLLPLRERCEHALQVFEQRKVSSLVSALLGVIFPVSAFYILMVVDIGAWMSTSISCLVLVAFFPWIHAEVLGTYTARQIALRIKRSLKADSDEPYLPSQSLLHGQYMILPHSPWYCEVTQEDDEVAELEHSSFMRRIYHRKWDDVAERPKPSAADLSLCLATDPNCTAQERAEAALVVFSKRFHRYSICAFASAMYALIAGTSFCFFALKLLGPGWPVASSLLVAFIVSGTGFMLYVTFIISTGAWVAYHIKSRICESLRSSAVLGLPIMSSECVYHIPSDALLRKGFRLVRMYPYYEELRDSAQDTQVEECQPKDVKFHEDE